VTVRSPVAAVLLTGLVACGCSAGEQTTSDNGPTPPTSSSAPSGLLSETEACAEVRAGIDSFNEGDLGETVRHFELAVPLAKELVAEDEAADTLLGAIEYYATLPPEEYQAASPSPEFQRNKAITLTLCEYGAGPEEDPSETQVPA